MTDNVSKLFIQIALSIDNMIGKGKVIDANFSNFEPKKLFTDATEIFSQIEILRDLNRATQNIFPFFKQSYIKYQVDALDLQLQIFCAPEKFHNRYLQIGQIFLNVELPSPNYELISKLQEEAQLLLSDRGYKGTLSQKVQQWKDANKCAHDEYMRHVKESVSTFSDLTFKEILPAVLTEDQIKYVIGQQMLNLELLDTIESWSAYNYYKGSFSGTVVFNKAGTFDKNYVRSFVSHEAFPGHHTSGLIKEYYSDQIIKDSYLGLQFLNTPSCLIEEGIADAGLELLGILPQTFDEKLNFVLDELNANVIYLVAYKLFVDHVPDDEGIKILKKEKLMDDDKQVLRGFKFIKEWKYYVPCYRLGREFIREKNKKIDSKEEFLKIIYLCPNPNVINSYVQQTKKDLLV